MASRPVTATVPYLLGVLGAAAEDAYARRIEPIGLRPKHVALLEHALATGPVSQREIATTFAVAPALVVSLVDDLEQRGLVVRERDPNDRRRNGVRITDAGRDALEECRAAVAAQERDLLAGLPERDRATLRALLVALVEGGSRS